MSYHRTLRRALHCLLWISSLACAAQSPQFVVPQVNLTGPNGGAARVSSFAAGKFEASSAFTDILYVNAPSTTAGQTTITAGLLLNGQGFTNLGENQIVFTGVSNVVAAAANFDSNPNLDFAFALSPAAVAPPYTGNVCIYFGSGITDPSQQGSAYSGSNMFPPAGAGSSSETGCLPFTTLGPNRPNFTSIIATPFNNNAISQLLIEDSANGIIYSINNTGGSGSGGTLPSFTLRSTITIPPADGPGPMYTGDFNGDGNIDILINNQTSLSVHIYLGNGDGTFSTMPITVPTQGYAHSVLLYDMKDNLPCSPATHQCDLIVEGDRGVITIQPGTGNGTTPFSSSNGGTASGLDGFSGNGGHLAAIGDLNGDNRPEILTTTPIGLSVLGNNAGVYQLQAIYNIGPGRSSFSLTDFDGDSHLDLAVDSAEGVVIVSGNGDDTFQTSRAYSAGAPALGAVVGPFRDASHNSSPQPNIDVAVSTTPQQAQLLEGDGTGAFSALLQPGSTALQPANPAPSTLPSASLWTNLLTGDFNGDGTPDLLYSATGQPLPTSGSGTGFSVSYGAGDGTFAAPVQLAPNLLGSPGNSNLFGMSTVADLNGDGISDIASVEQHNYNTILSQPGNTFAAGLNFGSSVTGPGNFNQVAAGPIKGTAPQSLVFEDGPNITPYVNSGDGKTFTAQPALSGVPDVHSYYGGEILLVDVDSDNKGDIVVPYHNLTGSGPDQLYIWYGNGSGTFSTPQVITLSRNYYLAQVVDMNNDGLPDVVLSDGSILAILYNQANRTYGGEQHFLAGQGINSISFADVNHDGSLDIIVANGGLTISDAVAIGGLIQPTITLTPNPDVNTGGITVLLNQVKTKPVTGTVTADPEPSKYGGTFAITASFTSSPGEPPPTGTVQFAINGQAVGSPVPLTPSTTSSSSTAVYTVPIGNTYPVATQIPITASYSGDSVNSPYTAVGSHFVQGGYPTITTNYLCVGPTPGCPSTGTPTVPAPPYPISLMMVYGQTFNGVTSAAPASQNNTPLTGTIGFYDGTTLICTLSVSAFSACPPSVGTTVGTSVGIHTFTAIYSGDSNFATSTSPAVTLTVTADSTSAIITSSRNPSPFGQPVSLTATLTGSNASPTGTVQFFNGSASIGTATLTPVPNTFTSVAILTTNGLPVGTDPITAVYAATQNFLGSTSPVFNQVITPTLPTLTLLTSNLNPALVSQSVTFTATIVLSGGASSPVPTGSFIFYDGATVLGTVPINAAGVATYTTDSLAAGNHPIRVVASGDDHTAPSSASLVEVVDTLPAPGSVNFTIDVAPSPISVGVGNGAALLITITPLNGFFQTVNLACANLPTEAHCTFANTSISGGSGQTTLLLTTTAPHSCGSDQPYFIGGGGSSPLPLALPALAGLVALFFPGSRRRRWLRALIAVLALAGAMQFTGCGSCTDLGTHPGTYTIKVQGSAAAGTPEVETANVTVNVVI